MRERFLQIKKLVVQTVIWAEKNLKGKSGAFKKKAVVAKITKILMTMIKLPWYLAWAKKFAIPLAVGFAVDWACETLNFMFDWNFANVTLTDAQVTNIASLMDEPMGVIVSTSAAMGRVPDEEEAEVDGDKATMTLDERLAALYKEYGVEAPQSKPKKEQLSANLTRREITCKCGCGFDDLDQKTIDTFQAIRDYVGQPVLITSGCRCSAHDKSDKVGGKGSGPHVNGTGLDMYVKGLSNRQFGELVKRAHAEGLLPHLCYCYLIAGKTHTAIHVDTDRPRKNGIWGW